MRQKYGTCVFLGCLLWACVVHAQYTIQPFAVPFPGSSATTLTGLSTAGSLVGGYVDSHANVMGFTCGPTQSLRVLPLLGLQALSPDGTVLAGQIIAGDGVRGFLLQDGTLTILIGDKGLDEPTPLQARVTSITGAGIIVGDFQDSAGVWHGFTYDPATQTPTRVDVPFPHQSMGLAGLNSAGTLVGWYTDDTGFVRGFVRESGTFTQLEVPGVTRGTQPTGITEAGVIVGLADDQSFLYQGGIFTPFTVPGALITQILGIREDGTLFGRYVDSVHNEGFLAFPPGVMFPAQACAEPETPTEAVAPPKHERGKPGRRR